MEACHSMGVIRGIPLGVIDDGARGEEVDCRIQGNKEGRESLSF